MQSAGTAAFRGIIEQHAPLLFLQISSQVFSAHRLNFPRDSFGKSKQPVLSPATKSHFGDLLRFL